VSPVERVLDYFELDHRERTDPVNRKKRRKKLFQIFSRTACQLESTHLDGARMSEIRSVFEQAVRENVVWEEEADVGRLEV
jgi:hypothetical protein